MPDAETTVSEAGPRCPACGGDGSVECFGGAVLRACPYCEECRLIAEGFFVDAEGEPMMSCPECDGRGSQDEAGEQDEHGDLLWPCGVCGGSGEVPAE